MKVINEKAQYSAQMIIQFVLEWHARAARIMYFKYYILLHEFRYLNFASKEISKKYLNNPVIRKHLVIIIVRILPQNLKTEVYVVVQVTSTSSL